MYPEGTKSEINVLFLSGLGLWNKVKVSLFWGPEADWMTSLLLVYLGVKMFIFSDCESA